MQKIQAESSRMEEDRSRLFAEISHELRTPLTAVQGFVEAIRDGMVQDKALLGEVFRYYLYSDGPYKQARG
ncbi:MAG: histidine kinase dimerization/phospho-acceptor domain-containing protein [Dethiobacteria bacterium]